MRSLSTAIGAAALVLTVVGCGGAKSGNQGQQGKVRFSAVTNVQRPGPVVVPAVVAPKVCGTFTLQPYSLDSSGKATPAGSPVVISSADPSVGTSAILGCIDNPAITGNDWGYLVTVTGFNDCQSPPSAIAGISPSVVTANFPIDCVAGQDVSLPISVDVSIPQANQAGYIDISVSVNSTTVQTGCKNADVNGGILRFGESYIDAAGAIHRGLLALDSGAPQQYGGTVKGAQAAIDTYYTGQMTAAPATLLQTFLDVCPGAEYIDMHHAQCLTAATAAGATTAASLADVFIAGANGAVSASITSASALTLYSVASSTGLKTMDASVSPAALGFNTGMATQVLAAPAGTSFSGVYPDLSAAPGLVVTGIDATATPVYSQVAYDPATGSWSAGTWAPISSLDSAHLDCLGIFATKTGCITPAACPQTGLR